MRRRLSAFTIPLLTLALSGCSSEPIAPSPEPSDELLAPPAAGKGIQYKMTVDIEAGSESEKCQFVKAPAEDLFVQRDEVRFTPGSHHFLLYETSYTEIPTEKLDGTKVDTSAVFDCSSGATNGWAVTKLVGGSQNADGASILAFPENVAMRVHAGAVLLMNAHYVNASSETVSPEVRINLHTIPKSQVSQEGDILFLYNPFIVVPALSESRARMRCGVHQDITLTNFQSHMHRRGTGYSASVMGEQPFYENDRWEGVPVLDLGAGKVIKKGSVLDYHCDYTSHESGDVFQGPRSTDEMCMAIGSYYPADPTTSNCAIPGTDTQETGNLGGDWVGNGEKTCAATMSCVQSSFGKDDFFEGLTRCVLDAAPSKSELVSDAIRCLFTHKNPLAECKTEFDACQAN
jgi:hypothetical protein